MIQVKDIEVLEGLLLHPYHLKLVKVVMWVIERYPSTVITCGYEERNYPSTHSVVPVRAIDLRSWAFANPVAVADDVNKYWIYDPQRRDMMCAIYHDAGRGPHLHLQAHERTVLR